MKQFCDFRDQEHYQTPHVTSGKSHEKDNNNHTIYTGCLAHDAFFDPNILQI